MISIERYSANCSKQRNHDEVTDSDDSGGEDNENQSNNSSQGYDQAERLILYKYLYDLIYKYAPDLINELKSKSAKERKEAAEKISELLDDPVIYHKA